MVYTSNLREIEAGLIIVGHLVSGIYMAIPPNLEKFNSRGNCGSRCIGGVSYHNLHILPPGNFIFNSWQIASKTLIKNDDCFLIKLISINWSLKNSSPSLSQTLGCSLNKEFENFFTLNLANFVSEVTRWRNFWIRTSLFLPPSRTCVLCNGNLGSTVSIVRSTLSVVRREGKSNC